jgi:hypothetical protein
MSALVHQNGSAVNGMVGPSPKQRRTPVVIPRGNARRRSIDTQIVAIFINYRCKFNSLLAGNHVSNFSLKFVLIIEGNGLLVL